MSVARVGAPTARVTAQAQHLLARGARGPEVTHLQRLLEARGFDVGAVDGDFGARTERAVRAFQASRGLAVDGVAGPRTMAALNAPAPSRPPPSATGNASHPTATVLRQGAKSPAVRYLQTMLQRHGYDPGAVDGQFGPRTDAAVRAFQRAHGLAADGVVGPRTWAKLTGSSSSTPVGGPANGSNAAKLDYAKRVAGELGLRITSTTGGRHVPGSYHYRGRAIDVAGSASQMAAFYRRMASLAPTELFYDPIGGIKNGRNIGAIGGHSDHVHVAF